MDLEHHLIGHEHQVQLAGRTLRGIEQRQRLFGDAWGIIGKSALGLFLVVNKGFTAIWGSASFSACYLHSLVDSEVDRFKND